MKKKIIIAAFIAVFGLSFIPANTAFAQDPTGITSIITAAIKKVIQAMDLRLQRLTNKLVVLQTAQKALENSMAKLKLNEISEWGEKQRSLYETYYNDLKTVRNTIAVYKRVKEVAGYQVNILNEYKRAFSLLSKDKHFSSNEISYMQKVYTSILNESVKNLEQLTLVASSFKTQMTDAQRLELIDKAADNMEVNYSDLRQFSNQNMALSIQRSRSADEILTMKAYYGIK